MVNWKHFGILTFFVSLVIVAGGMWWYYGAWALMAVPEIMGSALAVALLIDIVWLLLSSKDLFRQKIMNVVFQSIGTALVITVLLFFLGGKDILHL